ncbi:hypothetical protein [Streptomyces sp. NPDC051994]|uniref:hypothetical protein n=1 Tax=unclassified Streptomyces TaxID=2593676 RepID=UPI0034415A43
MARIRKAAAGSDSFGHTWESDGAVVDIDDPEQIAALLSIADAGFSEVTPDGEAAPKPDPDLDAAQAASDDPEPNEEFAEVDPKAEDSEAPKPGRRGSRKPAASQE